MTYHKVEYTLHNGQKIYAEYNEYNVCKVTKECMEMLLDLHWQGRTEAKEDTNLKDTIREIHDNVAHEMYCKGIDELVQKVKEHHYVLSDVINSKDYGMFTVGIEQIAEELKAGGENE